MRRENKMEVKLCINCARYKGLACNRETNVPNYVLGGMKTWPVDAYQMRASGGECGPEGRLFVPKASDGPAPVGAYPDSSKELRGLAVFDPEALKGPGALELRGDLKQRMWP